MVRVPSSYFRSIIDSGGSGTTAPSGSFGIGFSQLEHSTSAIGHSPGQPAWPQFYTISSAKATLAGLQDLDQIPDVLTVVSGLALADDDPVGLAASEGLDPNPIPGSTTAHSHQ